MRESLETFIFTLVNEGFKMASVDITGAFLQSEKIDREIFVRPPPDIRKSNPGIIWKLNKPLYGLDDACRRFYLKVLKIFNLQGF